MANQYLKLRRSSVPGKVPDTGSLEFGEIALNTYDGVAFMKKSGSNGEEVVTLGSTQGAFTGSFSGSFTGSLEGTSSWAENATSASYAYTASSAISSSYAYTASSAENAYYASTSSLAYTASSADDFVVRNSITASNALIQGTITAQTLVVQTVSSSVIYSSGSNIFGDELTDKQTFTGSVDITGSLSLNGFSVVTSDQTGSMSVLSSSYASTASYAQNAISASYVSGSAAIVTNLTSSNDALINGVSIGRGNSTFLPQTNTVLGNSAFTTGTSPAHNTAIGYSALRIITSGQSNTSVGSLTMYNNQTSYNNTAIGRQALYNLTTGTVNTAVGVTAGYSFTTGQYNIHIGTTFGVSGIGITTGSYNTVIGNQISGLNPGLSNNIIISDGQGNIKYRWDAVQNNIYGNLAVTGSVTATTGFTGSLFGTASWALNFVTESVTSASYAYTASSAVSSSYAYNADFLDGKDSSEFATTGSNIFRGSQTIDGNLFMSGSFRLIYNDDPTTNMLFGQFDGSQIYGPYYQLFGNQYSTVSQRGSAEFVYDTRNGGESGFNIVSFDGFGWVRRFRVDDNGAQVTGSLNVSNGITGSLYGTASWAENFVTESVTSASYAYTASSAENAYYSITSSQAYTASSADEFIVRNSITASNALVNGTITAQTLVVQTVSSSVIYSSGSNIFGDELTDKQTFTGSVDITGSLTVNGSSAILSNQTSSMSVLSSSYAYTASSAISASFAISTSYSPNLYNSDGTLTSNRVLDIGGYNLKFTGSNSALSGVARALNFQNNLVATANNDILVGLDIIPTFNNSSFTGVNNYSLRVQGGTFSGNNGGQIALSQSGSAAAVLGMQGAGWNAFGIWGVGRYTTSATPDFRILGSGIVNVTTKLFVNTTVDNGYLLDVAGASRITGGLRVSGSGAYSLEVTGSGIFTGGITGSLFGTASWAQNAVSASWAPTVFPYTGSAQITGSLGVTGSFGVNGSGRFTGNEEDYNVLVENVASSPYPGTTLTISSNATSNIGTAKLNLKTGNNNHYIQTWGGYSVLGFRFITSGQTSNTALSTLFAQRYANRPTQLVFNYDSGNPIYSYVTDEWIYIRAQADNNSTKTFRIVGTDYSSDRFAVYGDGTTFVSGSVTAVSGFTGSLFGTASWALNFVTGSVTSASYAYTASSAVSASYVLNAISASWAPTAFPYTGSAQITGSLGVTGSLSLLSGSATITSPRSSAASHFDIYNGDNAVVKINSVSASNGVYSTLRLADGLLGGPVLIGTNGQYGWNENGSGTVIIHSSTGWLGSHGGTHNNSIIVGWNGSAISYNSTNTVRIGDINSLQNIGDSATGIGVGNWGILVKGDGVANQIRLGGVLPMSGVTGSTTIGIGLTTNLSNVVMLGLASQTTMIGQGTATGSGAILQIDSTTKGFLLSRMSPAQRIAISSPARGLQVYDTGSATEGIWYYDSGSINNWTRLLNDSGSQVISGSLTATQGFTGSLFGTASWAQNALTASYALNVSGTIANATSASYAFTASSAVSSSYSLTSSYALSTVSPFPFTGSAQITGSLGVTGSFDVSGSARVTNILTIGNIGASYNIAYVTGGSGNINLGGSIGASPDRSLAVGGTSSGTLSTAVGMSTTATGGGTAIGGYQTVATQGVAIGAGVGAAISNGTQAVAIGNGATAYGNQAVAIGSGIVGASGNGSNGIAINGTVGAGFINGAIALGGVAGANQSVAIYGSTNASNELVIGAAYAALDMTNFAITNIYFGSGKQRANTSNVNQSGSGISYTINGAGAFGIDYLGGNVTIAGGKGTGAGAAGEVIISTATPLSSGNTLQSLTERARFKQTGLTVTGSVIATQGFTGSLFGTASWALNFVTQSVTSASYAYTASSAVSASYAYTASSAVNSTNALTASSADNFVVRQDITASNALINGIITAQTLVVQTVSSSVVYSSGSNVFGNNLSNTQVFTGSVNVTGSLAVNGSTAILTDQTSSMSVLSASYAYTASSAVNSSYAISSSRSVSSETSSYAIDFYVSHSFTASGLRYPTADDGEFSFIQTDGAGNLSLQYVRTINQTVYNGESFTLVKGTPVYISGSQGANPKAYVADASDPTKMPVTYVMGDTTAAGNTGRAISLGDIEGVNTTGYPAGTEIYAAAGGGWTSIRPTGSAIVQVLGYVTKEGSGGKGIVLNPGPANLPNIAPGYVWIGDSNSYPIASTTSSIKNVQSASYALTASYVPASGVVGLSLFMIATGSVTASVDVNPNSIFLIKSGSANFLNISSSGDTTLASNLFIVKNFTTDQPVLTVSESVVKIATHSFDPSGTTDAGSIWFTSTAMYVGLE